MPRRFQTLDVFTETALAGNPLAVVLDADGLDDARMQAVAAEFNLSETVFVLEPRNAINSARVRIFTPKRELPFAGHPTVGAAALIAHRRASDLLSAQDLRIVLEEPIGNVVCVARRRKGQALAAYFELPKLPERLETKPPSTVQIAASLGLELKDIGFDGHETSIFSAGAPFLFVPIRSLDAIGRTEPGAVHWAIKDGPGDVCLYTRDRARGIGVSWPHVRRRLGNRGRSGHRERRRRVCRRCASFRPPGQRRAHDDDRAGFRDGPAEPDRAWSRNRRWLSCLRDDWRLGRHRLQRFSRPLSEPTRLLKVDELDLRFEPTPWTFAERQATSIATHWARLTKAKPSLFNGRVLLLGQREFKTGADGVLRLSGVFFETDYADFIAWGDFGHPTEPVDNCFSMAALRSVRRRVPARRDGAPYLQRWPDLFPRRDAGPQRRFRRQGQSRGQRAAGNCSKRRGSSPPKRTSRLAGLWPSRLRASLA